MPLSRRQAAELRRRRRLPAQLLGAGPAPSAGNWFPGLVRPRPLRAEPFTRPNVAGQRLAARRRVSALLIAPLAAPEYVAQLATDDGYRGVPRESTDERQHRVQLAVAVNRTLGGKLNNTGDMTLAANSSATILKDARLSPKSAIFFEPMTANAAAELAAGTMYVLAANRKAEAFTITHANAVTTDRTFRYAILG